MKELKNRLIDSNIIQQMLQRNPLLDTFQSRLVTYDFPTTETVASKLIQVNNEMSQFKTAQINNLMPNLWNGILFVGIVLFLYFVLNYRYQRKKANNKL